MIEVPPDMPVTVPDREPTVATPGAPLLQVPPVVASLKVIAAPAHALVIPVIGNGDCTITWIVVVSNIPIQSVTLTLKESAPENPAVGV
jgi:hypothetical protein